MDDQRSRIPYRRTRIYKEGRRRGDIRIYILQALQERPMHGYEVIQYLESQTNGLWRPSPGSVYPTLQLLEEQELVKAQEIEGKRVYGLTDVGKTAAKDAPPREFEGDPEEYRTLVELKEVGLVIRHLIRLIVKDGDIDATRAAVEIMVRTKHELADVAKSTEKQ